MSEPGQQVFPVTDAALIVVDLTEVEPYVRVTGELITRPALDGHPAYGDPDITDWLAPNTAFRVLVAPLGGNGSPGGEGDGSPGGEALVSRLYTVREADAATERIVFDVLRHPGRSPMMAWLDAVRIGDVVPIIGPRPHVVPDPDAHDHALLADETAVPALFAILRQWRAGDTGVAYVQTEHTAILDELPAPAGVRIEPVGGRQGDGSLFAALRAHRFRPGVTPGIWAAGEREEMRSIKTYVLDELGFSRDKQRLPAYWHRGHSADETVRRKEFIGLSETGGLSAPGTGDPGAL